SDFSAELQLSDGRSVGNAVVDASAVANSSGTGTIRFESEELPAGKHELILYREPRHVGSARDVAILLLKGTGSTEIAESGSISQ
ncbi:MAG: hypothetical protein AAFU85_33415, partial [Planctomycetota bacterium]